MLAPWLLYSSFLGILLSAVALLVERILRWRGKAARWVWLAAIITMVAAPALLSMRPRAPLPVSVLARSIADHRSSSVAMSEAVTAPLNLDRPLLALWLAASTLLLLRMLGGALALHRRRRRWVPAQLGGQPVLLADELGPAVIGWRRFTTVIPRWALTFDERSRELMLAHEAEHASSGDPYLRSVALVALMLMPWNPALWFAMRRLRLAVEMDCDQRVLSRGADPQQYAALLLAVGERMSATPFAWATALGGTRSLLEKRVREMISPWLPRHPRVAVAAVSVAVCVVAIVACSAPVPDPVVTRSTTASNNPVSVFGVDTLRDFVADTLYYECENSPAARADTSCAKARMYVDRRPRPPRDTVYLRWNGPGTISPSIVMDVECEIHSDCYGFVGEGRRHDTLFVYSKDGQWRYATPKRSALRYGPDNFEMRSPQSHAKSIPAYRVKEDMPTAIDAQVQDSILAAEADYFRQKAEQAGKTVNVKREGTSCSRTSECGRVTKPMHTGRAGPQDDLEAGSPQPDGRGEFAGSGAHFCKAGDACDDRLMITNVILALTRHTDFVVSDTGAPKCTPAQAAAKRTKSRTGFYPRCVE